MTASEMILRSSAVLLDFDGIVVNSEQRESIVWEFVLRKHGIRFPEPSGVAGRMDEVIARSLAVSEEEAARLLKSKKEEFDRLYGDSHPPLVEGVKEFILAYHRIRVLGITSNSSRERIIKICSYYGLTHFFSVIVAARGSYEPKPSPQVYSKALEVLKVPSERVVAIEDSPPGFAAARFAGIQVVGLPTSLPKADIAGMADAVADSFWQIMEDWDDPAIHGA